MDDTPEPGNPFLQNDNKVQILSLGDVLLGILFTLLVNIWWIILLLVVLNLIDRHRFREYITKHPPGSLSNPPVCFRPLLFWHGQGSSWYRRMLYLVTEAPYEDDDDFEDDGDQPGPDGTGGAQENAYTGPGPDVGPQASGFRGDPQEAFRREHRGLWGTWSRLWDMGWEWVHLLQDQVSRLFGGRRM